MAIVSLAVIAACLAVGGVLFFLIRREIRVARVDINEQVSQVRAQLTEVGKLAGAAAIASTSAVDYVQRNMAPRGEAGPPPPTATPRPLAVQMGTEVVELDADIVARIEALTEDVNAKRVEDPTLARLIQAGLNKVEEEAPESGERGNDDSAEEMNGDSSADTTPLAPVDPTKLPPRFPKPKK